MMRTDNDKCLYILHKYMIEHPLVFQVDQPPSYGMTPGYDLVARNLCMNVIEYIEVELDATDTKKFGRNILVSGRLQHVSSKVMRGIRSDVVYTRLQSESHLKTTNGYLVLFLPVCGASTAASIRYHARGGLSGSLPERTRP